MEKHTKIVATLSDRRCDPEFIQRLFDAGMNVVRINTAHQKIEDTLKVIENVRKVSKKIGILIDTKGPEIRTTENEEKEIHLKKGEKIEFKGGSDKKSSKSCIYVNYEHFVKDVEVGFHILIDDGLVELLVIEKTKDTLVCEIKNDANLGSKKTINVPGAKMHLQSISKKDKEYINFAIEQNIDFIAHSFVRNKQDVLDVQKILDEKESKIKIISKIENQEGVDNLKEIIDVSYGIMVARGDLGTEIPAERIPTIQKRMIDLCIEKKKPVIVATQMLHTMIKNPRPTRAEVSDVANAIYDGADAIMLSGETAQGEYPVESVRMMTKVAKEIESHNDLYTQKHTIPINSDIPVFLAKTAIIATKELSSKWVIADTTTGKTVRYLSAFRGKSPIYAICYEEKIVRELALSYGVYAEFQQKGKSKDEHINKVIKELIDEKKLKEEDLVIIVAGSFGVKNGPSFIEVSTAKNLLIDN